MEEFENSKMVREKAQTRDSNLLDHVAQVGFFQPKSEAQHARQLVIV